MRRIELLEALAEILEVDHVAGDELLSSFPAWDSLGSLSFVAIAKSDFGVTVDVADLENALSINDLLAIVLD